MDTLDFTQLAGIQAFHLTFSGKLVRKKKHRTSATHQGRQSFTSPKNGSANMQESLTWKEQNFPHDNQY